MRGAPHPHPIHMLRSTEVILVLRLAQPAALARRFATGSTRRFRAALLPSAVAHINGENLAAAQALALYLVRHGSLAWRSIFADTLRPADKPQPQTSAATKPMRTKRFK